MVSTESDPKHLADLVGQWGRWQFQLAAYIFLYESVSAYISMGYNFHAMNVDYWCADVPANEINKNITNDITCNSYTNPNESCTQWQYNKTQFYKSIITEFDLVCDRQYFASLTQSMFMFGYVGSGLILSHYSDIYGRRPILWLCYILELLALISCAFSYNIYQYMISRLIVGLGHAGGLSIVYAILLESCGPKYRSDAILLCYIGWVLGYVLLPGFAYLLQDFRYMTITSILLLLLILIWFYFLYESPRWQLANGQLDKAEITIQKAMKTNGKNDKNLRQKINQIANHIRESESNNNSKNLNIIDILKVALLRKYTFIIWYSSITNSLIYFGFSYNMADFGGNFYISFLLSGLVELPSQLVTPLLLRFIGRRKLSAMFMILVTISCIAVIPAKSSFLKIVLALIGKFAITAGWSVQALMCTEIYPTVVRNTGSGASQVIGQIGSISSPFIGNLIIKTSLSFVMVVYAVLSTLSAVLTLYLPETKDNEIPDTLEDVEKLGTSMKK